MKIHQKIALMFDPILMPKAGPRALPGGSLEPSKLPLDASQKQAKLFGPKNNSVIANYTLAFMQKPSNHLCFTVFFTHATFSNRLLTCKQKFVKMVNFLSQN